jgi:hypothetical protein
MLRILVLQGCHCSFVVSYKVPTHFHYARDCFNTIMKDGLVGPCQVACHEKRRPLLAACVVNHGYMLRVQVKPKLKTVYKPEYFSYLWKAVITTTATSCSTFQHWRKVQHLPSKFLLYLCIASSVVFTSRRAWRKIPYAKLSLPIPCRKKIY